jgi:branched-chain amino acid transport system permease protein
MRFAPHSSPLSGVIVAIGLVMVLQSLLGILFGAQYRPMRAPFDDSPIMVGGVPLLSPYDVFVLAVALAVMTALALLFTRTSLGLQLRAAAFAPEVSRVLGVRVGRMVTIGWMLSAAVAALAAMLLVPTELGLNPHATDMLFVYAFAVAVVGGLDSPVGALVGGLVVGVAMTLVTGYLGATVAPIGVLVLLVGVLLVRPGGIFSLREARSA